MNTSTRRRSTLAAFLVTLAAIGLCSTQRVTAEQESPTESAKPKRTFAVYAKIILPKKTPAEGKHPVVESWIAKKLKKKGKTELRAVTDWIRLPGEGERARQVWSATYDGKRWGCPVVGSCHLGKGKKAGKLVADMGGWTPVFPEIKGATLNAEVGDRRIAVVEDGIAYVALYVGVRETKDGPASEPVSETGAP